MTRTAAAPRRAAGKTTSLALAPYSAWALLFILVPLVFVAYYAFTDNAFRFTTEHIVRSISRTTEHRPL